LQVTTDGMGVVKFLDFWNLEKEKVCGCAALKN
jgi:hypothetical protein